MKFGIVFAAILCGAYAAVPSVRFYDNVPQCQAPNGGGLTPVLKEFVDLLPIEELATIYITAVSSDTEVQEVMAFLESEEFHKILKAIHTAPEFFKLMDYACKELYLDAYYYYNKAAELLGLPKLERPSLISATTFARKGLIGMFEDMLDIVPVDKIKALFKEKVETDEYAKKGIELLKSEDFKKIFKFVEGLPEFQDILTKLRGMGVEVDKILEVLKKFFGW